MGDRGLHALRAQARAGGGAGLDQPVDQSGHVGPFWGAEGVAAPVAVVDGATAVPADASSWT
jgi:hypothetical protein